MACRLKVAGPPRGLGCQATELDAVGRPALTFRPKVLEWDYPAGPLEGRQRDRTRKSTVSANRGDMPPQTYVYIDGFNLYYGAVKGTPYKWLDIRRLCQLLLPGHAIARIKYFTARVSARKDDPEKPTRQQIYLRALRTLPDLDIIYGSFLSHDVMMPLADAPPSGPRFAKVVKTEEKGSDVNIAAHLIHDAHQSRFDAAVLVTNDSDLLEPIRIVRTELRLDVGILNPHNQTPSQVLLKHASFLKQIRTGAIRQSQFPDHLADAKGEIHKPKAWY